ncbi:MAG: exosortase [Parvularculaceae bacterium]|nr:exosortase [Parvularculaceae bacterium]
MVRGIMMVVTDMQLRPGSAAKARQSAWPRAIALFTAILFTQILLMWPTLGAMARTWVNSSVYHHGAIAAPLSLWLILRRRGEIAHAPQPSWAGMALALAFIAAWLTGRAASTEIVAQLAFVGIIIASVIAVFGARLAREWAFALAFLFFMVPFGEALTPALQSAASVVVTAALNVTGIETAREGHLLTTAAADFEMAQACAGLRFVLAMAMAALLAGELAFDDWRKKISFLALALAAAIVANWVRAYLIVATVTLTDRAIGVGAEHVALGWIIYSTLIIALVLLARRMTDSGPIKPRQQAPAPASTGRQTPAPASVAIILILAIVGASSYDRHVVSAAPSSPPRYVDADFTASAWTILSAPRAMRVNAGNPDHVSTGVFSADGGVLEITLANFGYDNPDREITGFSLPAEDRAAWRMVKRSAIELSYGGNVVHPQLAIFENSRGERMAAIELYFLGEKTYSSLARLKVDLALQKLRGEHFDGGAMFAATPLFTDETAARQTLQAFFNAAEPLPDWRSRVLRPGA